MPHIEIDKRELDELMENEVSEQKLREEAAFLGAHSWEKQGEHRWDVETYPNRPDFLSVEGLARAYRGFFGFEEGRVRYEPAPAEVEVSVEEPVKDVRPHIGCAVVRNLELPRKKINGLIQLQEKLHETMGRRREKLAIGLHDLSGLEPPFRYTAKRPGKVSFRPLESEKEMDLGEILETHEKGRKYSWILEEEERYPVIIDSDDQVLSFPPIINNQLTEVEEETEDVFIDVTGMDEDTVRDCLNIIVTALAERGGDIEKVDVDGEELPVLEPDTMELDTDYVRNISGLDISADEIAERLESMRYSVKEGEMLEVEVPCYRTDVMHDYDLIEDVVIAHRYSNVEAEMPEIDQTAELSPVEGFSDLMRDVLAGTGALETHTYILTNEEDVYRKSMLPEKDLVRMENPLTEEHSIVRPSMLPGLLKALSNNRHRGYPQELFEIGEVSVCDDSDTGASDTRKLCYVACGPEKGFTDVRKILQVLERDLGVELEVSENERRNLRTSRSGIITCEDREIGYIGELDPEARDNWELEAPVAVIELDVDILHEAF